MGLEIRIQDEFRIPADVQDFASFRRWALSEDCPEMGRIDFLQGTVEVDMAAEELMSHGALKMAISGWLYHFAETHDLGWVFADQSRVSCPPVGLSAQPDVVFVSHEGLQRETVRFQSGPDRFMEIEGAPSLVVEVVSKGSVGKDTRRLPPLYARAGISEFWSADGRGKDLRFSVFHLSDGAYVPSPVDSDGFQSSVVLNRQVRLTRRLGPFPGTWRYLLEDR